MAAKQRVISIKEFARAMLGADSAFAQRVRTFESRFGEVDADTLAVLAQAAYLCWYECDYASDLLSTCRAIGTAKPTSIHHCAQVTPERWAGLNAYVVGAQRWLGVDLSLPDGVDGARVERIGKWLGERDLAKEALVALFLCQLVDHLVLRASFSVLGEGIARTEAEYADYTAWYTRPDGLRYATGRDHDAPSDDVQDDAFVAECVRRVRREIRLAPADAQELIEGILRPSQPPCMHRFQRYQDIKLASIGALAWRGNLPPDDLSKAEWKAFWAEAEAGLRAWLDGAPPSGEVANELHRALGKPTERRKAVVRDFSLAEKTETAGYHWLKEKAHKEGAAAGAVFGPGRWAVAAIGRSTGFNRICK